MENIIQPIINKQIPKNEKSTKFNENIYFAINTHNIVLFLQTLCSLTNLPKRIKLYKNQIHILLPNAF